MKFAFGSTYNVVAVFLYVVSLQASFVVGGQIRICLLADGQPLKDTPVNCWDEDPTTADDFMTSGMTGTDGCVTMSYETKDHPWWSCNDDWDGCSPWGYWKPDIYCRVDEACLEPYQTSTKDNWNQYSLANFGTVTLTENEAYCSFNGYNGCGPSQFPDWLSETFDQVSGFQSSCNDHDLCYNEPACLQPGASRSQCDDDFLDDMYAECDAVSGGIWCDFLAHMFYTAVIIFGGPFYC